MAESPTPLPPAAASAAPAASAPDTIAPAVRKSSGERIVAYRLLLILGILVFTADQLTKLWIVKTLPFPTPVYSPASITVIDGFFYIVHVGNTGAAWSMFTGQSYLLALLAAVTLGAIFWWRHALGLRDRLPQICFGLLCGGILGNLVDRVVYKHVVDFIDLHFGTYVYPTFNVADSGICVGVILYLWHSFRSPD